MSDGLDTSVLVDIAKAIGGLETRVDVAELNIQAARAEAAPRDTLDRAVEDQERLRAEFRTINGRFEAAISADRERREAQERRTRLLVVLIPALCTLIGVLAATVLG